MIDSNAAYDCDDDVDTLSDLMIVIIQPHDRPIITRTRSINVLVLVLHLLEMIASLPWLRFPRLQIIQQALD